MPFVLDASVAVAWCYHDETTPYAVGVLKKLDADAALVPSVWPLEVANAVCIGERRQRLRPADIMRFTELVCALPIMVDSALLPRDLGPVLDLARTYQLSSYDASYIELAVREALPLATQDSRLQAAAAKVGVSLVP